ncbi:hypothetical protein V6N13_136889 [Hibiscus sabdariffa]|uniref:Uncharacterized protein n=1 Tax=Hibiscus sabdariffa TaxID=183260 RepID=A0ABR2DM93_9ROSI
MDNSRAAFGPLNGTAPAAVNVININDNGGSGSNSKYIVGGGFGVVVFWGVIIFTMFKYKKSGCGCSFSCKGSCQISSSESDACVVHSKDNADKV